MFSMGFIWSNDYTVELSTYTKNKIPLKITLLINSFIINNMDLINGLAIYQIATRWRLSLSISY